MNIFLDIETIPCQAKRGPGSYSEFLKDAEENFSAPSSMTKTKACEDLEITGNDAKYMSKDDAIRLWVGKFAQQEAPNVAEENWRKTSFDGGLGEIISLAWATDDSEVFSISRELDESEPEMLRYFFASVSELLNGRSPMLIGQFIAGFDLMFIFRRCVVLGVKPSIKLPFNGRHGSDFYCTQIAWAGFKGRYSQDSICKVLGIEGKPNDIDGSKVWNAVKAGNVERVEEYNRDDVSKVRQIYNRLTFNNQES